MTIPWVSRERLDEHKEQIRLLNIQLQTALQNTIVETSRVRNEMQARIDELKAEREAMKIERDEAIAKLIELLAAQNTTTEYSEPEPSDGLPKAVVEEEALEETFGLPRAALLRRPGLFARATTLRATMKHNKKQIESTAQRMFDAIEQQAKARAAEGMRQQRQEHADTVAQDREQQAQQVG